MFMHPPRSCTNANRFSANHRLPQLTHKNFPPDRAGRFVRCASGRSVRPPGMVWRGKLSTLRRFIRWRPGASIIYSGPRVHGPRQQRAVRSHRSPSRRHRDETATASTARRCRPTSSIAENQYFLLQAAAEGMSIVFSSGDDSDLVAINGIGSGSWEATSPYVTGRRWYEPRACSTSPAAKAEWGWGHLSRLPQRCNGVCETARNINHQRCRAFRLPTIFGCRRWTEPGHVGSFLSG